MLLRHSLLYLLGRGGTAVVNLMAVALYTRLLNPEQYGRYALVFAGAMLANAVFFQWLRMGLLRFLPSFRDRKDEFLSTVAAGFLVLVLLTGFIGAAMAVFWPDRELRLLIALAVGFFWLHGWFEINLELMRSQLAPVRYGLISTIKASSALAAGGGLIYAGFGPAGILLGLMAGILAPMPWLLKHEWQGISLKKVDREILRRFLSYGVPLTGTFALSFLTTSADRFLLGWLVGTEATGLYSVANDFAKQSLLVLMMTVNLAAFPLAVRAFEQEGQERARSQMSENGTLLLAIALPVATGLAILSPNISALLLGQAFRTSASVLIPWIVLGTFLNGLRIYYFDQSFHLGKATARQVWVVLGGTVTSIGMNFLLIPRFGMMGAAYSNVIAFAVALWLSWSLGKKIFPLPLLGRDRLKLVAATAAMAGSLWFIRSWSGTFALACQVLLGAFVYCSLVALLNINKCRNRIAGWIGLVEV